VPGSGYTINGLGTAVGLSVPDAVAGELILAVWLMAGNLTITAGGNWQGIASFNTPTLRLLWRVATGPETFAATMSGSNAWSICAGRFVPATPAPLKAWDGSSWRAVART
jgi:hypothetical protein